MVFKAPVIPEYFGTGFLTALVVQDKPDHLKQDKVGIQAAMCCASINQLIDVHDALSAMQPCQENILAQLRAGIEVLERQLQVIRQTFVDMT